MSILSRSLVLDEIKEYQNHLIDLLPMQYLSIRNESTEQLVTQVIKVSGNITISF